MNEYKFMNGKIIDGTSMANAITDNLKEIISTDSLSSTSLLKRMTLIIVTTGVNDASKVYVRSKSRKCEELGIQCVEVHYDYFDMSACKDLMFTLSDYNFPPFIVQLPMTGNCSRRGIYNALYTALNSHGCPNPEKKLRLMDVDGIISKDNIMYTYAPQYMAERTNRDLIDTYCLPCTPAGMVSLILAATHIRHRHVVVLGRSELVGKPVASMLQGVGASVTMFHSMSAPIDIENAIKNCDVLVSAMGNKDVLTKRRFGNIDLSSTILIDAGMNRDENGKLRGDCDPELLQNFTAYTPVPGGVGPMTVASLMVNVVKYYQTSNMANYAGALLPIYLMHWHDYFNDESLVKFYKYRLNLDLE